MNEMLVVKKYGPYYVSMMAFIMIPNKSTTLKIPIIFVVVVVVLRFSVIKKFEAVQVN